MPGSKRKKRPPSFKEDFLTRLPPRPNWIVLQHGRSGRELVKFEALRPNDIDEYESLVSALKRGVKSLGDYAPDLDDPLINQAARAAIYVNRCEEYMDTAPDTKFFAAAADAQSKALKRLQWAIDTLATNRKARLKDKSTQEVAEQVRLAVERVIGESPAVEKLDDRMGKNSARKKTGSKVRKTSTPRQD